MTPAQSSRTIAAAGSEGEHTTVGRAALLALALISVLLAAVALSFFVVLAIFAEGRLWWSPVLILAIPSGGACLLFLLLATIALWRALGRPVDTRRAQDDTEDGD